MNATRAVLRGLIRPITRTGLPGRYQLVEILRPLLVQDDPVIAQTSCGVRLQLDLRDLIQRQIFFDLYDREDLRLLRRLVGEGDVVFDVGGNIGFYTVALARRVGPRGRVHVFEPIPENLEGIRRNVRLNGLDDVVVVNAVAVADRETELELYVPESRDNTGWASIVPSETRQQRLVVRAIALDHYVREEGLERVALIKMDIEGAELQALQGMTDLLGGATAPLLYLELNPYLLAKQEISPVSVKQFLDQLGYTLFAVERDTVVEVPPEGAEQRLRNILASKRPVELAGRLEGRR